MDLQKGAVFVLATRDRSYCFVRNISIGPIAYCCQVYGDPNIVTTVKRLSVLAVGKEAMIRVHITCKLMKILTTRFHAIGI
jgi:hypothetical protein